MNLNKLSTAAAVFLATFVFFGLLAVAISTLSNSSITTTGTLNASGTAFVGEMNLTGNLTVDALLGRFGILNVTANTTFSGTTNLTNATIRSLNVTDNATFEAQTVRFKDLNATNITATAASVRSLNASTVNITGNLTTKALTALSDSSFNGRIRYAQTDAGAAMQTINATFVNASTGPIWSCNMTAGGVAARLNVTHLVLVNLTNGDGTALTLYLPVVNITTEAGAEPC